MADTKKRGLKDRLKYFKPMLIAMAEPFKVIISDPLGRIGGIVFFVILLIALFAPLLATHDPNQMNEKIEGGLIPFASGSDWQEYQVIGEYPLNDLFITEDSILAAADHGLVYKYTAATGWQEEEIVPGVNLLAAATHDGLEIVAGEGGILYLRKNELDWQEQKIPKQVNINDIAIISNNLAYAVGNDGLFLSWNGAAWEEMDTGVNRHLRSLSFLHKDDGIIVGDRGTILHYLDGEFHAPSFQSFTDATFRDLFSVSYYKPEQAFAVGERSTIIGYDGDNWRIMPNSESRTLKGVTHVSQQEAYAVGLRGTVLGFDGTDWETVPRITRRDFRGITFTGEQGFIYGVEPYVNELAKPSSEHLFGTTHLGRDIWSQVIYGSRTALMVGILAALVVNILGVTIGLIAGYYRGVLDNILMRIVDIMYGLPLEPFAIILVLIFQPSIWIIILAIGLLTWRTNARIIRSQVLSIVERPFVKAARVAGASDARIMLVHITPNILPLAFLELAVAMGYAITAEATLSFLGLGPPQIYSWGTILHAARLSGAWRTAWWWVIPPGLFICITVVSVFLISRALEVLTNPRLRGGRDIAPGYQKSKDLLSDEQ